LPRASEEARKRWRDARLYQTKVQEALRHFRIPFAMWLLLETLYDLLQHTGDAVSQAVVAEQAGLTKHVVSYWMGIMSEEGYVSREPDDDGRAYRVITTAFGDETLAMCNERLEERGLFY
jgi:DNA-binding MarR family transcriptional regulator